MQMNKEETTMDPGERLHRKDEREWCAQWLRQEGHADLAAAMLDELDDVEQVATCGVCKEPALFSVCYDHAKACKSCGQPVLPATLKPPESWPSCVERLRDARVSMVAALDELRGNVPQILTKDVRTIFADCLEWLATEHVLTDACPADFNNGQGAQPYGRSAEPITSPTTDEALYVVFDAPPGPESARFVEIETKDRRGCSAGKWRKRHDGFWTLGPFYTQPKLAAVERDLRILRGGVQMALDGSSEDDPLVLAAECREAQLTAERERNGYQEAYECAAHDRRGLARSLNYADKELDRLMTTIGDLRTQLHERDQQYFRQRTVVDAARKLFDPTPEAELSQRGVLLKEVLDAHDNEESEPAKPRCVKLGRRFRELVDRLGDDVPQVWASVPEPVAEQDSDETAQMRDFARQQRAKSDCPFPPELDTFGTVTVGQPKPTERPRCDTSDFFDCNFCGCNTNANLRQCCALGWLADGGSTERLRFGPCAVMRDNRPKQPDLAGQGGDPVHGAAERIARAQADGTPSLELAASRCEPAEQGERRRGWWRRRDRGDRAGRRGRCLVPQRVR
jgi:hypothetical protein